MAQAGAKLKERVSRAAGTKRKERVKMVDVEPWEMNGSLTLVGTKRKERAKSLALDQGD